MTWWMWLLIAVYALGFVATFVLQGPMVTMGLAFLRSAVWPIFWATGWPGGEPLRMD